VRYSTIRSAWARIDGGTSMPIAAAALRPTVRLDVLAVDPAALPQTALEGVDAPLVLGSLALANQDAQEPGGRLAQAEGRKKRAGGKPEQDGATTFVPRNRHRAASFLTVESPRTIQRCGKGAWPGDGLHRLIIAQPLLPPRGWQDDFDDRLEGKPAPASTGNRSSSESSTSKASCGALRQRDAAGRGSRAAKDRRRGRD